MPDIVSRAQNDGLASLKLTELRQIASSQGLRGTSGLRKGDLINAISAAGIGGGAPAQNAPAQSAPTKRAPAETAPEPARTAAPEPARTSAPEPARTAAPQETRDSAPATIDSTPDTGAAQAPAEEKPRTMHSDDATAGDNRHDAHDDRSGDGQGGGRRSRRNRRNRRNRGRDGQGNQGNQNGARDGGEGHGGRDGNRDNNRGNRGNRDNNRGGRDRRDGSAQGNQSNQNNQGNQVETTPVAGILDFADANTAFIRTTGYHAGPTDVYVPIQMVRRYGMRHGDAVTGTIRPGAKQQAGGGRRNRQKYTPLNSVETVNGLTPEQASQRPHFHKMTPLYPNQRLRLETEPKILTTRVIDLIMPIGKGQRALIVSPPKAGKTTILQDIANAIATNNPECYLMVVLVDERPEEVTDMSRSVKGEVIASTFDRPPSDHTAIAELAIERAKRLVEQGKDVVVLLDSITRLGRAYNNSSPASGRILSGGVDSNALYPPKRFLGAARNIENGGSLTIIATAMVETGSAGDTVIFEEFKGTGNAELKLDRKIAERRMFPAVDVNPSGTRKDELLLVPEEARLMHKLRRILSALDPQAAIDLLLKQLKKTKSNGEFMMQIASSAPLAGGDDDE
ncbi:transcription termination factor Rho [Corynebacterium nuruki]|uniref:transcription termination factor Rho n=1 Tax=Corynebacterium nuruki TaxID=1032851 RepID=UPI0039BF9B76